MFSDIVVIVLIIVDMTAEFYRRTHPESTDSDNDSRPRNVKPINEKEM